MTVIVSRRGILRCLGGLIAAPAVVKADALMRIVAQPVATLTYEVIPDAIGYNVYGRSPAMEVLPDIIEYLAHLKAKIIAEMICPPQIIDEFGNAKNLWTPDDLQRRFTLVYAPANRAAAADPGLDPVASTAADLPRRLSRPAS